MFTYPSFHVVALPLLVCLLAVASLCLVYLRVTSEAEALQIVVGEAERFHIALCSCALHWYDVMDTSRAREYALVLASFAERVIRQLLPPELAPLLRVHQLLVLLAVHLLR